MIVSRRGEGIMKGGGRYGESKGGKGGRGGIGWIGDKEGMVISSNRV
jgi:hypothetical protein